MKKMILKSTLLIAAVFFYLHIAYAQEKQYKVGCIAFYNLENLYDTINDPDKNDEEFTPNGKSSWTSERYNKKIKNLSEVISQVGDEYVKGGPAIMGISEVENKQVVEDLISAPALKSSNYGIVHYDSPDRRGVDVALIYQKEHFKVLNSNHVKLSISGNPGFASRDQLVVSGIFDG
ncbi:MAG: endonuclease/exonuclease/phosphatase family protein, partial [Bacteroidetes bacterium]|nr:endonuclease/exonuclease/phosphatase family protein [Bacteroidota bacterium]